MCVGHGSLRTALLASAYALESAEARNGETETDAGVGVISDACSPVRAPWTGSERSADLEGSGAGQSRLLPSATTATVTVVSLTV